MLVSFKISNFLSFNREQTFSMVPSLDYKNNFHINSLENVKLLKMGIILGANSSGKSNLLKAIAVGASLIKGDSPNKYKSYFCKLNRENKEKETIFEYSFYINNEFYTYGFSINLASTKFLTEYLLIHDQENDQEKVMLERVSEDNTIENLFTYKFDIGVNIRKKLNKYIKDFENTSKTLFITKVNKDIDLIKSLKDFRNVYTYFKTKINTYFQNQDFKILDLSYTKKENEINNQLSYFDTGIEEIVIEEIKYSIFMNDYSEYIPEINQYIESNEKDEISFSVRIKQELFSIDYQAGNMNVFKILLRHKNADYDFEFSEESDGVRRLFDLLDILLAPEMGSIYLFDELSRSLHPLLIIKFLETVNNNLSDNRVQLVFSTHEASILKESLIRKDEIWFVGKGNDNASKLYSLDIFKLTNKKLIDSYLDGNYGAIPIFFKDEL
ncbi:MAG: ATP-binding protein [Bacilli bacterium]|nr:ATP-binding protein [Bacilli bacterium]